jgi:hypothetical protein
MSSTGTALLVMQHTFVEVRVSQFSAQFFDYLDVLKVCRALKMT